MINYIASNKPVSEISEIMEKINDYIRWGNKKSLSDDELKIYLKDQYNNCRRALEMASSLHEIDVKRPILYAGHLKKLKKWSKRIIRKMTAWYAQDLAVQQSQFNVKSIETMLEHQRLLSLLIQEHLELKEKMNLVMNEILPENSFDEKWYLEFENKFRGSKELVYERNKRYVKYFEGKKRVVDLGCGRGEFLELLRENGIPCVGIDTNRRMLAEAMKKKLKVREYDCIEYLRSLKNGSVDGIFAGQLVEHLSLNKRVKLLELACKKLKTGGVLVLETVNPLTLGVFCYSFYTDATHTVPVHPATLRFMAEQTGFETEPVHFAEEFSEEYKFTITPDMSEGTKKGFEKLNRQMFGAQDYYLVCTKGEKND